MPPEPVSFVPPRARAAGAAGPGLTVIVPAYNETGRIGRYLDEIRAYFATAPLGREGYEVLVVDDGSTDDTAGAIRTRLTADPALGLLTYSPNRGKGYAVRAGMAAARGRLRLFADADGSTPIAEIARLHARLPAGPRAVAVGSRDVAEPGVTVRQKPHRRAIGAVFRALHRGLLGTRVSDTQCGFKLFTADAADAIFGAARLDGFAFDVEALHLAARLGIPVVEVAVNWRDAPDSRVRLARDAWRMFRDLCRIRRLHR